MPSRSSGTTEPVRELAGRKFLVSDLDLQQAEHRGIAAYSKSLLKALKESGAEIWLLTDIHAHDRSKRVSRLPRSVIHMIELAKILQKLSTGSGATAYQPISVVSRKAPGLLGRARIKAMNLYGFAVVLAKRISIVLLPRTCYTNKNTRSICIDSHDKSPYANVDRLAFLECISGIVSAKHLYASANRLAKREKPRAVRLSFEGSYDALITTCPLNIAVSPGFPLIQTVHDLIPLEYADHPDHASALSFVQRLASCRDAQNIFVSQSTMSKYEKAFAPSGSSKSTVVIQPPSLMMAYLNSEATSPKTISISASSFVEASEIESFRYILFNSSIESRKNIVFLIKAFKLSCLQDKGIRLCIAGKLKQDIYSSSVMQEADESVLLTDYVDEATKTSLFLNSLCVASPSLVEGFGIPVLDSACLGVPALVSPTEPHAEIQGLYDFAEYISIADMHNPMIWARAMNEIVSVQTRRIVDHDAERRSRIVRYESTSSAVFEAFRKNVVGHLSSAMQGR